MNDRHDFTGAVTQFHAFKRNQAMRSEARRRGQRSFEAACSRAAPLDFIKLLLRTTLSESRGRGANQALAQAIDCRSPYLSRVLNGDAHLSLEQAEKACRHLGFASLETDYFLALVSRERASTTGLRKHWQKEIDRIRLESASLEKRLRLDDQLSDRDAEFYYSSWVPAAVHVAASIPGIATAEDIARQFNIPYSQVNQAINYLLKAKLIENTPEGLRAGGRQIHLSRTSPLVRQHHANWKLKSMDVLQNPLATDLHYTSIVGISESGFKKVREKLLETAAWIRENVRADHEEVVGCYSLDLFKVSRGVE